MNIKKVLLGMILPTILIVYQSIYTIEEGEQVLLTRFGALHKGPIVEPGYHFKMFTLDRIHRYPAAKISVEFMSPQCASFLPIVNGSIALIIEDLIKFRRSVYKVDGISDYISNILQD